MIDFFSVFHNAANKTDREWDANGSSLVTGPYGQGKALITSGQLPKTLTSNIVDEFFCFHYMSGTSIGNDAIAFWQDGNATLQVELRQTSAGVIQFTRNGTVIGSSSASGTIQSNTTYWFVGRIKIDATAGIAELKIYTGAVVGVTLNIGITNLNTKNGSNAYFNQVRIQSASNSAFANYFLWNSTAGSGNDLTGYPANEIVSDLAAAISAGTHAQWTPLSSTNVSNIDDTLFTCDDDTTYNASLTAGQIDDFNFSNVSASTGVIIGIGIITTDRIDDATPHTVDHHVESAAAVFDGTAFSLSGSYKTNKTLMFLDPNTSAVPTITARNAMKIGYKLVS